MATKNGMKTKEQSLREKSPLLSQKTSSLLMKREWITGKIIPGLGVIKERDIMG